MDFASTIERDLLACFGDGSFSIVALHSYGGTSEILDVIFDVADEVILQNGEYEGSEASVPSLLLPTSKAGNIDHNSLFRISQRLYGVVEVLERNDGTTKVFLDVQDG